jgi:hypothetical protein
MPLLKRGMCPVCNFCLRCEIARKAEFGRHAIYSPEIGQGQYGPDSANGPLDDVIILPKLFSKHRARKKAELGREPMFYDVKTDVEIGSFKSRLPLSVAALGSTKVANEYGVELSKGAAKAGIPLVIGENMFLMRGFDKRKSPKQPCLLDRALAYLDNLEDYGGLVIQGNLEDRNAGLFELIMSSKELEDAIQNKKIAFEIKLGQGAKPGLGGEVMIGRKRAKELKKHYAIIPDPDTTEAKVYERHSAPGTWTEDNLAKLVEEYDQPIWVKTAGYDDLVRQIEIVDGIVDLITLDGSGGTGMSPIVSMQTGYPTLKCLELAKFAKKSDVLLAGGLTNGADIVKTLALGADGVSMGRAFMIAQRVGKKKFEDGSKGIKNFVDALLAEVQMLTSALGKYELEDLDKSDVKALDKKISRLFVIGYVFDPA